MATEGTSGSGRKIERLVKGDDTRTMMHTDVANEIIDAINALYALTVTPQGAGKFVFAEGNVVLSLETTDECPP